MERLRASRVKGIGVLLIELQSVGGRTMGTPHVSHEGYYFSFFSLYHHANLRRVALLFRM